MEIPVVVQLRPAVLNAPGADKHVDGLANDDSAPGQETEIAARRGRQVGRGAISCDRSDLWIA